MSPAQTALFWRAEKAAWTVFATACGLRLSDQAEHDAWRHEQIGQATGGKITSTKDIGTKLQFEAVMLHLSLVAGDDAGVEKWTSGAEQRNAWVIRQKLALLSWVTGIDHDWSYARGIFTQMRLPDTVLDCPSDLAQKVMMAADTQFRRYCADAGVRPVDAERAKILGAPWITAKTDRDFHPVWQQATAQNQDTKYRPRYDHDHPSKRALVPA